MILVVGATGLLGSEIVRRLGRQGERVRAMVRATANPERLDAIRQAGAELVFGDLKDPASLLSACRGTGAIIATASSTISRQPGDDIASVDRDGYLHLIQAAVEAKVPRFVYISIPRDLPACPLTEAKAKVESALASSGLEYTILAANFFMEVWLSPALGFDVPAGRVRIYGSGEKPVGFVSYKDVAEIATIAPEIASSIWQVPLASSQRVCGNLSVPPVVPSLPSRFPKMLCGSSGFRLLILSIGRSLR